ncbi:MAG TPA: Omp28-related outer membrane protein [Bacteroidota bacterium]|nr:Omp28-related outer membrane protein [Bacteroidota bacterium]
MNKFSKYLTALVIFLLITSISFAANKVVLLEQFTGTWCGYCPEGSYKMDQIVAANSGKVIGVRFHLSSASSADSMEIPEVNTIAGTLGLSGVPTGLVNRLAFSTGSGYIFFLGTNNWEQCINIALQQPAPVDLKLDWSYNEETQKIEATITGTFDQNINEEIRFNVYVIEDNIPATGTGYEQRNYYNGSPSSPFYQKGDPINDYYHMKVVRALMGGAWGQPNSIPLPVTAGSKVSYYFSIPKQSNWNIKNISLVGVVQYFTQSKREILNAIEGVKFTPKTKITTTGNRLFALPTGSTNTYSITVKNTSTKPVEYQVEVDNSNLSWDLELLPSETSFTIQPGATRKIDVLYKLNSIGAGTAGIEIVEEDGSSFPLTITGYTSDAEYLQVNSASSDYGIISTIKSIEEFKNIVPIPVNDYLQLSSNFNQLKLVYWCLGEDGAFSSDQTNIIQQLINNKTNILFTGPMVYNSMHTIMPTFENQLGIKYIGPEYSGYNTGTINLTGVTGDPISDGFSSPAQLVTYLPMKTSIINQEITFPVITIASRRDTILGTRTELGMGKRIVIFSFNVAKITNETQKNNLMKNALNWLLGIQTKSPKIAVSATTLDFGDVATDSSGEKTLTIQNNGTADLNITSTSITNNADNSFSIVQSPSTPIAPGGSSDVIIKFAPKDLKLYLSPRLQIVSNDPTSDTTLVSLRGRGTVPQGISRDILSYFNVTPNVISDGANINFAIASPVPQNVKIYLMDLAGRKIADIKDGIYSYGEYKLNFSTSKMTPGAYFVIAQIGNSTETVRINVVK